MHIEFGDTRHSRWIHTKKSMDYHGDFVESVPAPIQFMYRRAGRQAHCGDGPQRRAALCPIEREGERERVKVRQRELRDLEVLRCKSSAITVGAKRRFGARHKSVPAVGVY